MNQHTVAVPIRSLTPEQVAVETLIVVRDLKKEIEDMADEIRDLRAEVTAENEEDVLSEQERAQLRADKEALTARVAELEALVGEAVAGREGAEAELAQAFEDVRTEINRLAEDNPVPEPDPENPDV